MHELAKNEKKLARAIISGTVEKEFETALKQADTILSEWKSHGKTGRVAFHELRDYINNFRKHLSGRYDNLGGSNYLLTVVAILKDGYITEEDIKGFSEETEAVIRTWTKPWDHE